MANTVSKTVTNQELNAIMYIESGGRPDASAYPASTALGLGQFLKSTWRDTVRKFRPDVFKAIPNGKLLAMRKSNPSFMIEMLGRFTEDNRRAIGATSSLGDLYLAHFFGTGTAKKVFRADANTPVEPIAGPDAVRANPSILRGKTCGQVRAWANSKMAKASKSAGDYVSKYYAGRFELPMSTMAEGEVELDHEELSSREVLRPGIKPNGDAKLYDNQLQLKTMNYNPGGLDGVWGGMTSGAMAGFLGDRSSDVVVPKNAGQYNKDYDKIDAAIDLAEGEGFRRPVTKEREEADVATVERVAPEIVDAKQGRWGAIGAFFSALGGSIYSGFNWLMGYKDQASEWGIMYYIDKVPTFVWLALGSGAIGFVLYKTIKTVKGIEKPVTTGERM